MWLEEKAEIFKRRSHVRAFHDMVAPAFAHSHSVIVS